MSDLRSKVIRLAHARPDLRPALLPLLKESAPRVAGKPHEWLLNNPEANRLFNAILGEARKVDWEPYMVEAALDILEKARSVEDIPRIYSHGPRGYYGIGGDRLQDMYEEKSNPFGARRAATLNLLLENPRIKGLIHKYIEAAEKTGVSAVVAAQWLDDKALNVLANNPNPKIFIDIDTDNRDIAKAIEEIEENDEEYQDKLGQEERAYNRSLDRQDRW